MVAEPVAAATAAADAGTRDAGDSGLHCGWTSWEFSGAEEGKAKVAVQKLSWGDVSVVHHSVAPTCGGTKVSSPAAGSLPVEFELRRP